MKAPSPPRARQAKIAKSGEHHETERPDLKAAGITRLLSQRGGKNLDSKQLPILSEQLQEMRASKENVVRIKKAFCCTTSS